MIAVAGFREDKPWGQRATFALTSWFNEDGYD